MPVLSYHSCLISDTASPAGGVDTTSSQILLSRGVAGSDFKSDPAPRPTAPTTTIASVFESATKHIMTLGDAACHTTSTEWEGKNGTKVDVSEIETQECSPSHTVQNNDGRRYSDPAGLSSTTENCLDNHLLEPCTMSSGKHTEHFENILLTDLSEQPSGTRIVDKGKEEERGRSPERKLRHYNPLSRAGSKNRGNEFAIDVDARPIQRRTASRSSVSFDDSNDPAAILEDSLLEPYPEDPICNSFLDVLNSPSSTDTTTSSGSVSGQPSRAATFNETPTFSQAPTSLASTLATEIIQQIMYSLSPADFNAARHTCRSWYINSLNQRLLETMLRRGGNTVIRRANHIFRPLVSNVNDEWLMSKRISRECALGPDWTGSGTARKPRADAISEFAKSAFVRISTADFTEVAVNYPGPNSCSTVFTASSCGKFLMAANGCLVYVYRLNRSHKTGDENRAMPGALRPVTTIICPRQVLACSMDTSSHRYAIAVLLDGRMGFVSDISVLNDAPPTSSSSRSGKGSPSKKRTSGVSVLSGDLSGAGELQGTSFLDRISLNSSSTNLGSDRSTPDPPFVFLGIATTVASFAPVDQPDVPSLASAPGPEPEGYRQGKYRWEVQNKSNILNEMEAQNYTMTIENGPRSLYRNLCSDDDPPRSVAICPQRRCVAFGCSSGIELHWVDALTGQDLNRWFPLTAPSDFLFFLPPRKSIDSAKKLRLISSAARPNERPAIAQRPFGGRSRSSPFWEPFGMGANQSNDDDFGSSQALLARLRGDNIRRGSSSGRLDTSDHYRAIPLSDGYHILFTDPATGLLCLGSDAPVGGPTKLLRKIWFQGPAGQGSPLVYAGGSDLRWGVRVVAAFGVGAQQTIWLFSVPHDIFTANHGNANSTASQWPGSTVNRDLANIEWASWWPDDGLQEWLNHVLDPTPGILPRSIWPVKIRGQKIGSCNGVVDLAIDAGPQMTIWAFSRHGIAKVWKLDDGSCSGVAKRRWVMRDGTVRESEGDGDIKMCDAPHTDDTSPLNLASRAQTLSDAPCSSHSVEPPTTDSFDGSSAPHCSYTTSHSYPSPSLDENFDSDGDVLMHDLRQTANEKGNSRSRFLETVVELGEGRVLWKRFSRWGERPGHDAYGTTDIVEELTGMARIDVEIR